MSKFRCLLVLLSFCLLAPPALRADNLYAYRDSVKNGYNFLLYVPDSYYSSEKPLPVILCLHGKSLAGNNLEGITRYGCIDALRRSGLQADHLQPEDAVGLITDDEAQERSEREARLWQAVERLPRQRRELLLMSKRDAMSYEEIAEAAGLSVNTVRNQISRALHTLRSALSPDGGTADLLLLLAAFPAA
jgi:DNA-binding CsgD family transcriptional regulator